MSAPFSDRHLLHVSAGVNSSTKAATTQDVPRGSSVIPPHAQEALAVIEPEPARGKGPLQGVGIRPWLTPRGGVNRAFCALLKRRIVSLVMISPGIPEVRKLNHRFVRDFGPLLSTLCVVQCLSLAIIF